MNILINTATPTCELLLTDDDRTIDASWEAGRDLAHSLLAHVRDALAEQGKTFHDISGIGIYQGPGSFTGLRISLTVCNTLASDRQIPIVGVTGDNWQQTALNRLAAGENDTVVLPIYDRPANITAPRK